MTIAAFGLFAVASLVLALAAVTGYRGRVCDRRRGYPVPADVSADPALRSKANGLVAFWCAGAAIMSLAPLHPLFREIRNPAADGLSTPGLLALAVYALLVGCIAGYPFEKIKHLAGDSVRH
ncbi:hypothetical protein [Streptomyces sp. NPDC018045]|uniref:hypothetical protein n=1 Tax=Streptomyces sp. NPDC018045 TaxID=3365037 RepID=UPI00378F214B